MLLSAAAASVYSRCWETMKIEISSVSIGEEKKSGKEGKMPTIYSYVRVPVHWSIGNSSSNSSLASGLSSILDLVQLNWADLVVATRPRRQSQWQWQYLSIQKKTNQILLLLLQQIADSKCCALWIVAPRHPSAQTMQTGKQLAAFILLRA